MKSFSVVVLFVFNLQISSSLSLECENLQLNCRQGDNSDAELTSRFSPVSAFSAACNSLCLMILIRSNSNGEGDELIFLHFTLSWRARHLSHLVAFFCLKKTTRFRQWKMSGILNATQPSRLRLVTSPTRNARAEPSEIWSEKLN